MNLLIATSNKGKIVEISEALQGLDIVLKTPLDVGITESPHEHGDTYEENALEKARFYHKHARIPTLADDSGIVIEALEKELGVHTRRWGAGPTASDADWIEYFLQRMSKEKNRRARFVCCLALIDADGSEHLFTGTCDGVITESLEAGYLPGLPISACFRPDGFEQVYSAMNLEQKNSTSHRGRAVLKLREFLKLESGFLTRV